MKFILPKIVFIVLFKDNAIVRKIKDLQATFECGITF